MISTSRSVALAFFVTALVGCAATTDSETGSQKEQSALGGACLEGKTRAADDGCNECTCVGGKWQCTELGCTTAAEEAAPKAKPTPPNTPPPNPTSPSNPGPNPGGSDPGPDPNQPVESPTSCTEGDRVTAADGCNECTCVYSDWQCTELACAPPTPAPLPTTCVDGDEAEAPDGCNWCHCDDGEWWCTELGCTP